MKKTTMIMLTALSAILFSFKTIEPRVWSLDKAHAKLGFSITHLMVSDVEGGFKTFDATVTSSKEDFSDAVTEMTADVASINTDNEKRDAHLKSVDFFDAAKYPSIIFKSTSFKKAGGNKFKVTGNLTMHGITKLITLDAVYRSGLNPMSKKPVTGFKITGTLNRSDFGIGGSMPTAVLGEEVSLVANAEFVNNQLPE
jgi:polyisoprenoid-binding protein YceI